MLVRTDAGGLQLGARPIEVRPDGYRVYRGRIPADVVMRYPDLSPPRSEFIPADEALSDEALASMRGAPFSVLHADDLLDATTVREHMVGTVLAAEANWESDPPEMVVDVIIHDLDAQMEVESGRLAQISPGYRSEEDWTPGVHKGQRYQVVQRRRRYNHLAAVPAARTVTADGRPARLDEHPGEAADGAPYSPTTDARTDMRKKKITQPDGTIIEVEVPADETGGTDEPQGSEQSRTDAVVLSPEDIEVLKKMSPEGFMAVSTALGLTAAAMPEPDGDEVVATETEAVEADAAGMDPGAPMDAAGGPGAGGGGAANPADADMAARLARLEAASAAIAAAEAQRTVAERAARATFDASAKFVGVVRKDGHAADTTTEAAAVMLRVIGKHLPRLDATAKAHAKAQRLDDLVALYQQAEDIRRDAMIQSQADGVAECLRADDSSTPDVLPFRAPRARGA